MSLPETEPTSEPVTVPETVPETVPASEQVTVPVTVPETAPVEATGTDSNIYLTSSVLSCCADDVVSTSLSKIEGTGEE